MCGITGFLDPGRSSQGRLEETVQRMAQTLRHRGPDDAGVWTDPDAGLALGHRRLSILDLSATGHQPMLSACGRYALAFNGEIYNHRPLRASIERSGSVRWRGTSDTEVLLAAVSQWGLERALQSSNGMFALALWDKNERRVHLARDRMGEKPLFYGKFGDVFLFGSELKALRAHPGFEGKIDRDALTLYLRFGYVPAPHSIYRDVKKIPPGTMASFGAGDAEPRLHSYWDAFRTARARAADPFRGGDDEAVSRLDELLSAAVKLRMEADVPLGAFLSGGIDSSTVVALMQAQSPCPVKTFSIGFQEAGYDEAAHARAVAKHIGTDHTELYATPREAMAAIPLLPALYDEPFADSSQLPTYLVSALARKRVTVSLSGDGGDELFGGYNRYFWGRSIWAAAGWLPVGLRSLLSASLTAIPPARWDSGFAMLPRRLRQPMAGDRAHKLAAILDAPSPDALYGRLVSLWQDPASVVLDATEPPLVGDDERAGFVERMMLRDATTYLPDDILVKLDRATMGVSLEGRVPLLDHNVVEFAWSLPLSLKLRDGRGKWILRRVLDRYVPSPLIERPKMGFGVPIDAWLRGPLRDWAEDLLAERRIREDGFFDPAPIRARWREHLSGGRNWQYALWAVLMFQAWLDVERAQDGGHGTA